MMGLEDMKLYGLDPKDQAHLPGVDLLCPAGLEACAVPGESGSGYEVGLILA